MQTYVFKVVMEPDADGWLALCPALDEYGAATWGHTEEEALKNIRELVEMILLELAEDGLPIPQGPSEEVFVSPDHRIAVPV